MGGGKFFMGEFDVTPASWPLHLAQHVLSLFCICMHSRKSLSAF